MNYPNDNCSVVQSYTVPMKVQIMINYLNVTDESLSECKYQKPQLIYPAHV